MSTTNFFTQLGEKGIKNLSFTFDEIEDSRYMIIIKQNPKFNDDGANMLPPQVLKGTLQDMDNYFFDEKHNPLMETATFVSNINSYHKMKTEADKATKEAKDKKEAADKEKKDKDKKLKNLVEDLNGIFKEEGFDIKNDLFNQRVLKATDKILAIDPEHKTALEKKKEAQNSSAMPSFNFDE